MIKSFTVGVKHHVNLGSYESIEVDTQVTMDIEDMDFDAVRVEAQNALRILQNETFLAQHKPSWFDKIPLKKARTENR